MNQATVPTNLSLAFQFYKVLAQPTPKVNTVIWEDATRTFVFAPRAFWDQRVSWNSPTVRACFDSVVALVAEEGMQMEVILQPSKELVHGPFTGAIASQMYDASHYETYLQLEKTLKDKKISVVDLTPALRKLAQNGASIYHVIDGHFNERGHEATASILAERYREMMKEKSQVEKMTLGAIECFYLSAHPFQRYSYPLHKGP